jgi:hypothetical protein
MPAPGCSTFDGNPNSSPAVTAGYRPGAADFNGAALTNLGSNPPNPATMPTAELLNTDSLQLVSVSRMVPFAAISVTPGSSPSTAYYRTAANNIASNPFTITRNAAGDYSITYPTGTFPAPVSQPTATLNAQLGAHTYAIGAVNITNGVRVTTVVDGALADVPFTVNLY